MQASSNLTSAYMFYLRSWNVKALLIQKAVDYPKVEAHSQTKSTSLITFDFLFIVSNLWVKENDNGKCATKHFFHSWLWTCCRQNVSLSKRWNTPLASQLFNHRTVTQRQTTIHLPHSHLRDNLQATNKSIKRCSAPKSPSWFNRLKPRTFLLWATIEYKCC